MINILDNIEVLYHSCIKINKEKIIYIDPYHIDKNYNDADIIFITHIPVGGTYTMDFKEAAQLINIIKPKFAIPVHYGSVVGSKQDATDLIKLLYPTIKGIILINQ